MSRRTWRGLLLAALPVLALAAPAEQSPLLVMTASVQSRPSPALMAALGIAEADARGPRPAPIAALDRLDRRAEAAIQTPYDRAWVQQARATLLAEAGQTAEAIAAWEALRDMPRTPLLDREALMALHALGQREHPGACPAGALAPPVAAPDLSGLRSRNRLELGGRLDVMADVDADGRIGHAFVVESSARSFEAPLLDWLRGQRYRPAAGGTPGAACIVGLQLRFTLGPGAEPMPRVTAVRSLLRDRAEAIGTARTPG